MLFHLFHLIVFNVKGDVILERKCKIVVKIIMRYDAG
jgi:hypothetical protein